MTTAKFAVLFQAVLFVSLRASSQTLSKTDQQIVDAARSRYYSLPSSGFSSLNCSVAFDWSTVPPIPLQEPAESRTLLQKGTLTLKIDIRGVPNVEEAFPNGTTEQQMKSALPLTNLLKAFVGGVFQTWPSKGLQGPIPPFNSQIESVSSSPEGFDFSLRVPGSPVHVFMNKEFIVSKITSLDSKVVEWPTYRASPNGMVFVGNRGVDTTSPGSATEVVYELGIDRVNGLQIPSSVRLKVNSNIDVRYKLESCIAQRGIVLKVAPPAIH